MGDLKFYGLLCAQVVGVLVLLVLAAFWPGPWNTQRMVGSALLVSGLALVFTARLQLGPWFSVMPRAKKLVTHGVYSKIRNPIYVFGTTASAGVFLILQIPRLWVLLLVLALIQVFRAREEARALAAKFGDQYRAYRDQTWF
jgi:protein-S-isoprenylcysteine O-methyltransferase Ste14